MHRVSSQNLKPCPFCGGEAGVIDWGTEAVSNAHAQDWQIQCCHCGASPFEDWTDKATAIRIWNKRFVPVVSEEEKKLAEAYGDGFAKYIAGCSL